MPRWFNAVFQVVALIGQVANYVSPWVPAKYHATITAVLSTAQGIVAVIAHNWNPDGTPSTTPYKPPIN